MPIYSTYVLKVERKPYYKLVVFFFLFITFLRHIVCKLPEVKDCFFLKEVLKGLLKKRKCRRST